MIDKAENDVLNYDGRKNEDYCLDNLSPEEETKEFFMFEVGKYETIGYKIYSEYPNYQQKYKSLCNKYQIAFLLGLINEFRFSNGEAIMNVIEIGTNNGVTSLYMLKAGCAARSSFKLYSLDIKKGEYFGKAVLNEATPKELSRFHLHLGHTCFDIEKILGDNRIDMVFIDGGHTHPHPIIDLIFCYPFLHDESIIMLHDVVDYMRPNAWGESFIYSSWKDEKYRTVSLDIQYNPIKPTTLGCIKIPANKKILYDNILQIVKTPFRASPWAMCDINLGINENHLFSLKQFMDKYYERDFAEVIFSEL